MTRTYARKLAVQLSFAEGFGSDIPPIEFLTEEYLASFLSEDGLPDKVPETEQLNYIIQLVNGVSEKKDELDEIISGYLRGWKLNRISKTALTVLRCALYEIIYMDDVPASAAINEAVELCKEYDDEDTVRFVNGILGSFMRDREGKSKE